MQQSMGLYNEVAGLLNVFACVDGTHVKIISPPEGEVAFVNRKNYFSIKEIVRGFFCIGVVFVHMFTPLIVCTYRIIFV